MSFWTCNDWSTGTCCYYVNLRWAWSSAWLTLLTIDKVVNRGNQHREIYDFPCPRVVWDWCGFARKFVPYWQTTSGAAWIPWRARGREAKYHGRRGCRTEIVTLAWKRRPILFAQNASISYYCLCIVSDFDCLRIFQGIIILILLIENSIVWKKNMLYIFTY